MPEGLPAPIRLVLVTDLVFVRAARKMVEALLAAQGWPEEPIEEAALVATELVQNAIEHGSLNDGTETVGLSIQLEDASVLLEMSDPGTGKDPSLLLDRDVTTPVPLDASRGRGLFLINRLATQFERVHDSTGGCRVRARMEPDVR